MLKSPGFTAVAVTAPALGIGANTAIFSVVNAVLFKPLPHPDSERLFRVQESFPDQGRSRWPVAVPTFRDWREQNTVFAEREWTPPRAHSWRIVPPPPPTSNATSAIARQVPATSRRWEPRCSRAGISTSATRRTANKW